MSDILPLKDLFTLINIKYLYLSLRSDILNILIYLLLIIIIIS